MCQSCREKVANKHTSWLIRHDHVSGPCLIDFLLLFATWACVLHGHVYSSPGDIIIHKTLNSRSPPILMCMHCFACRLYVICIHRIIFTSPTYIALFFIYSLVTTSISGNSTLITFCHASISPYESRGLHTIGLYVSKCNMIFHLTEDRAHHIECYCVRVNITACIVDTLES